MNKKLHLEAARDRSKKFSAVHIGFDYSARELEFLKAIGDYKRRYSRPHPTWVEVLAVLETLGYTK